MSSINCFDYIKKRFDEKQLSHSFLIQTNDNARCLNDINNLILYIMLNDGIYDENHLVQMIENQSLPNVIVIMPDGPTIKKEQIISMKKKLRFNPVYGRYNFYVIIKSECLNEFSANTMLKFLEEPDSNIVGFFVTNNKDNIISTIKSRCQIFINNYDGCDEFNLSDLDDTQYQELFDNALDFIQIIEKSKYKSVLYIKTNLYKINRNDIKKMLYMMLKIYKDYMDFLCNIIVDMEIKVKRILIYNNKSTISKKILLINDIIMGIEGYANLNLILDRFVLEMGNINE